MGVPVRYDCCACDDEPIVSDKFDIEGPPLSSGLGEGVHDTQSS